MVLANCLPSSTRFNTQPPEGGWLLKRYFNRLINIVSTHSRPKAAGTFTNPTNGGSSVSTHSRPKAAGLYGDLCVADYMFQHTAARRRLGSETAINVLPEPGFNTQPPEGGWVTDFMNQEDNACFNTQPPEGGWAFALSYIRQ